jgi:hypothetical protein
MTIRLTLGLRLALVLSFVLMTTQCARTSNSLVSLECTGNLVVKLESTLPTGLQGVKVEMVAQKVDINGKPIGAAERLEKIPDSQGTVSNTWRFKFDIGDGFSVQVKAVPPNWQDYQPSKSVWFDWTMFDKIIDKPLEITQQITLKLATG